MKDKLKGSKRKGCVYLVGAGPGDYRLITYRAMELFKEVEVLVYDRLVNPSLLAFIPDSVEKIYAGKARGKHSMKQQAINELLIRKAEEGKIVVRLKGGDPFVFGRGGEEALALEEAGLEYEIVPGISSVIAVAAYAGIPVTHRDYSSSFHVLTAHDPERIQYEHLVELKGTIIFLMGLKKLKQLTNLLLKHGFSAKKPVAVIHYGTTSGQLVIKGDIETITQKVEISHLSSPVLIVIGDVVRLQKHLHWYNKGLFAGKRIMVTRPFGQKESLAGMIEKLGGEVLYYPTIEIKGPVLTEVTRDYFSQLKAYDWVFFTSVNGVKYFFEIMQEMSLDIRELGNIKFAVIGLVTEKALRNYGIIADLLPDKYSTSDMFDKFVEIEESKCKILLPRADIASKELFNKLKGMGHDVDDLSIYRTIVPEVEKGDLLRTLEERGLAMITFTSSSTVSYLAKILRKDLEILRNIPAACIGPVTADTAQKLGFNVKVVPEEYTVEGLIDAMKYYWKNN